MTNLDTIKSSESANQPSKYSKFIENTKKAVRDTLIKTGMGISTMVPMATTTTPTVVPASVNTITAIAPIASTTVKTISLGAAAQLLSACGSEEGPEEIKDTTPPNINVSKSSADITGGKPIQIIGNQLYIGGEAVASRTDNKSKNCKVSLSLNGKSISSGATISEEGTLSIKVTDEAGNSKTADIKLNLTKNAPNITVAQYEIDISGSTTLTIKDNQLLLGEEIIASRTDDNLDSCKASLKFNEKEIKSGDSIDDSGILTITITNKNGLTSTADIKLNVIKNAPNITTNQEEINIFGGVKVIIKDNQLLFGEEVIASRTDDNLDSCKASLKFNGKDIKSGDTINESGTLILTITNKNSLTSTAEFTLNNEAIYGLDNLKNAHIQVDQEINLLDGLTFADGVQLLKTQIEIDSKRSNIDPSHYTPSYPGKCSIIFTLKGKNGNTAEVKVDNLTINALDYHAVQINNIKPADILPFLKELTRGDKDIYKHIEHLRLAESTRVRDMMREYGTGKYSPEQYQQLMLRLNTGMIGEYPLGYDNYEIVGGNLSGNATSHAHVERNILNNLIKHANFKICKASDYSDNREILYNLCRGDPNRINIMGCSIGVSIEHKGYEGPINYKKYKEYDKAKNQLIFKAGNNIRFNDGILQNKFVQEEYDLPDEHSSYYYSASRAHSKNDHTLDRHLMITIGTNKDGDIDQTNEDSESSMFPVGFHDKVLFSGRGFPIHRYVYGDYGGRSQKYPNSDPNYLNVAMADLCFQIKADTKDVDELLEMIRSTALTDYIRLDGQTQPLQLINPAGVFKKYLMPTDLPSSLRSDKTASLNKGFYSFVIFDIPGAEVKIDGKWIAYSDTNRSLIKNHNPKDLEWRLNGDLCKKMGYKGKTIKGKIIAVDDKWNGLNLDKDFSVTID